MTHPSGATDGFLVVLTLQRGEPPVVETEGEGLRRTIRVGDRAWRFDGRRVQPYDP